MNKPSSVPAVLAYLLPVVGWLYVFFFQRKNALAVFHLRQSIGLCLFLLGTLVAWIIVAWLLAWIPLMSVLAAALFSMVIAAWIYGVAAWVMGMVNAARQQQLPLPLFGQWANRLPIGQHQ